jgi:chloramphenicol 3-O phosphotransferase
VTIDVIVLNGGSSSGKTSLAPYIQQQLPGIWLVLGVDDLIRALSFGPSDTTAGHSLDFKPDGSISVSEKFRQAESAWRAGVAAMASRGIGVIVDDVFLDGRDSQAHLSEAIGTLTVVWVGVRCAAEVAASREAQRGDRMHGLALDQAIRVHEGVRYDMVVDTTMRKPEECARDIVEYVTARLL